VKLPGYSHQNSLDSSEEDATRNFLFILNFYSCFGGEGTDKGDATTHFQTKIMIHAERQRRPLPNPKEIMKRKE